MTTIGGQPRPNAQGSILIIEADTLEEARTLITNDVYWKNGVVSKHRNIPFTTWVFTRCYLWYKLVGQRKGCHSAVLFCNAISMIFPEVDTMYPFPSSEPGHSALQHATRQEP
jgi:hypothetical protein